MISRARIAITFLSSALVALPCGAAFSQERKPQGSDGQAKRSAKKPPAPSKQDAGIRTPELKPLAPPQIFATAFEYFRQGQFSDAEELFLAGLARDDRDYRAWEWLARTQAALSRDAQAEQSLQEAMKRGLTKEREEQVRMEMFFAIPDKFPAPGNACLSQEAQQAFQKIRVPRARHAFEVQWDVQWKAQPGGEQKSAAYRYVYAPIGPGLFIEEQTVTDSSGPASYKTQHLGYLGAFATCELGYKIIDSVEVQGMMFPLRVGNRFVVKVVERFNANRGPAAYRARNTQSCDVTDSRPASPDIVAAHPAVGQLISVECDWDLNGYKTKFTRLFSTYLGSFIPYGGNVQVKIDGK